MKNDKNVYPIRDKKKIDILKKYLHGNPRNHLLFVLGVNSGIRVCDMPGRVEGGKVVLKESKTDKINFFIINREIHKLLSHYLDKNNGLSPNDFLFRSRKGGGKMRLDSVNRMIKKWCKDLGIKENVGCRTLRKTFGYYLYHSGVSVEVIQKRFNHSSSNITLRYIGIDEEKVEDTLINFNL